MTSHAPPAYVCPLCRVAAGAEHEAIVYSDDEVVAALSLHQRDANPGSLLVFPRAHIENLYVAPLGLVHAMFSVSRALALALKDAMSAEGVTILQNNEPAGGQDVWHVHAHVIPRHENDQYFSQPGLIMPIEDRAKLATTIRTSLEATRPFPFVNRSSRSPGTEDTDHVDR